jgi:hypothetical protein
MQAAGPLTAPRPVEEEAEAELTARALSSSSYLRFSYSSGGLYGELYERAYIIRYFPCAGRRLGPLSPHPHAALWLEIAGLAADGLAFARGGGGGGGRGNARKQQLLQGGGGGDGDDAKKERHKENRSSSSSKGGKKDKGKGKGKQAGSPNGGGSAKGQAAAGGGGGGGGAGLEEQRVRDEKLHESQAKIRVVGLNTM